MVPHALTSRRRRGIASRSGRGGSAESGAVAVELGLLLPILVLIILGIVGLGLLYNAQLSLQGSVREGARAHALRDGGDPVAITQNSAGGLDVDVTASSPDPCEPGEDASVTATYDYEFDFLAFQVTRTLSATAVMRCERGASP